MKEKIVLLINKIKAFLPTRLPMGIEEFNAWAASFSVLFDLPTKHEDSIRFMLSSMIMHLGPQVSHRSKYYFYKSMLAGASKQIAGSVFHEIKEKQKAAEAAAKAEQSNVPPSIL